MSKFISLTVGSSYGDNDISPGVLEFEEIQSHPLKGHRDHGRLYGHKGDLWYKLPGKDVLNFTRVLRQIDIESGEIKLDDSNIRIGETRRGKDSESDDTAIVIGSNSGEKAVCRSIILGNSSGSGRVEDSVVIGSSSLKLNYGTFSNGTIVGSNCMTDVIAENTSDAVVVGADCLNRAMSAEKAIVIGHTLIGEKQTADRSEVVGHTMRSSYVDSVAVGREHSGGCYNNSTVIGHTIKVEDSVSESIILESDTIVKSAIDSVMIRSGVSHAVSSVLLGSGILSSINSVSIQAIRDDLPRSAVVDSTIVGRHRLPSTVRNSVVVGAGTLGKPVDESEIFGNVNTDATHSTIMGRLIGGSVERSLVVGRLSKFGCSDSIVISMDLDSEESDDGFGEMPLIHSIDPKRVYNSVIVGRVSNSTIHSSTVQGAALSCTLRNSVVVGTAQSSTVEDSVIIGNAALSDSRLKKKMILSTKDGVLLWGDFEKRCIALGGCDRWYESEGVLAIPEGKLDTKAMTEAPSTTFIHSQSGSLMVNGDKVVVRKVYPFEGSAEPKLRDIPFAAVTISYDNSKYMAFYIDGTEVAVFSGGSQYSHNQGVISYTGTLRGVGEMTVTRL